MLRNLRIPLCALAVCLGVAHAGPWPSDESDLPLDPAIVSGMLPNGVRYSIMRNATPTRRVSVRLLVAAGSMEEGEANRGVAHFVEHMVFRGSVSHPRGTLLPTLELKGMTLGPEVSAFTFYDHTIYGLELEDAASLGFGLGVMREFASEATFEPDLLDEERGVVLSEMDLRDTPEYRIAVNNLSFLWPNSRYAQRMPIGTRKSVQALTRADLRRFYETWYRPERLAIVIVGDVDPRAAQGSLAAIFGALKPRAAAQPEPPDALAGEPSRKVVAIDKDAGLRGVLFEFENPVADPPVRDTHERRVDRIRESMVTAIMQRRMSDAAPVTERAYSAPIVSLTRPHAGWKLAVMTVSGSTQSWKQSATELARFYAQVSTYGFSMSEVEWIKKAYLSSYDEAVRSRRTRPSNWLADGIAQGIVNGTRPVAPETALEDIRLGILATDPDDCMEAFKRIWMPRPHLFVAENSAQSVTVEDARVAVLQGLKASVTRYTEPMTADFAYESFGNPGSVARESRVEALDVSLAEFENGTRLNFKHTDFEADQVTAVVRVGAGKLTQPTNKPGIDLFAWAALLNAGLNGNTTREIQLITTGHNLNMQFYVDTDSFVFSLHCPRADFPLGMKLVTAYLTDASFDPGAMLDARAQLGAIYGSIASTEGMAVTAEAERLLSRNDRRFGVPAERDIAGTSLLDVGLWVAHQFKHGPLQLTVVGDIPLEEARAAAAATIGALPMRDPPKLTGREGDISFVDPNPDAPYSIPINQALIRGSTLGWFWPVADLDGIHSERRCRLLTMILAERIRIRLREQMGATYSPTIDFVQHEGFKAFNYVEILAPLLPGKAGEARRIVDEEVDSLIKEGVPDSLFARVKESFLRMREDDLQMNSYWANTVLRSPQTKPDTLAAALDRTSDCVSITRPEIEALARRYLVPSQKRLIVAEPSGARAAP